MHKKIIMTLVAIFLASEATISLNGMQEDCYVVIRGAQWPYARFFADQGKVVRALLEKIEEKNARLESSLTPDRGLSSAHYSPSSINAAPTPASTRSATPLPTDYANIPSNTDARFAHLEIIDCEELLRQSHDPRHRNEHRGLLHQDYSSLQKIYLARKIAHQIAMLKTSPYISIHLVTHSHGIELVAMASQLLNNQRRNFEFCINQRSMGTSALANRLHALTVGFQTAQQILHHEVAILSGIHRDAPGDDPAMQKIITSIHNVIPESVDAPLSVLVHDPAVVQGVHNLVATAATQTAAQLNQTHPQQQTTEIHTEQTEQTCKQCCHSCWAGCLRCCTNCMHTTGEVLTSPAAQEVAIAILHVGAQIALAAI